MAISWAQGLLAGAAGVAEYSKQEQEKRQKREDRTTELQNQMRMHQAKSTYAVKLNEYAKNREIMKALEAVPSGSVAEQITLFKALGYSSQDAGVMAERALKNGKPLARPGQMEMPEILFKASEPKVALSPLDNWVRNFVGRDTEEVTTSDIGIEPPVEDTQVTQVPTASTAPTAPTESIGTQEPVGVTDMEVATAAPEQMSTTQDITNPFAKPEEWDTRWTPQEVDGKRYLIAQQSTKAGKTRVGKMIPLGAEVPDDATFHEFKNGDKTDVYMRKPGETKMEFVQSIDTPKDALGAGRGAGEVASETAVNSFVKGDEQVGVEQVFKSYQTAATAWTGSLPEKEQDENNRKLGQLFITYRNNKKKTRTPQESLKYAAQDLKEAQGYAYLNTFEDSQLVEMLTQDDNPIDPTVFKGPNADMIDGILDVLAKKKDKKSRTLMLELESYIQ